MFNSYLKIFLRNLRKSPIFILINSLGLAVGMTASILIFLFIQHELSYDRYHERSEQIFRLSREWVNQEGNSTLHLGHAAPPFGPLIKSDFDDQIQEYVRLLKVNATLKAGEKIFNESRFFFSDPSLFKLFSWKLLEGNPNKALTFPDGIILSTSMAKKYFGNAEAMGQRIELILGNKAWNLEVRGVMEDIPDNSHFQADFLTTMHPVEELYEGQFQDLQNFGNNSFATYLLLKKETDPKALEAQFSGFLDRHMPKSEEGIHASKSTRLHLWPLKDIHLHSNLDSEIEPNSSIENVYIYSVVSLFILLIASINFMNLATARSARRALEVGVRKVMGAEKRLLVWQFMTESVLVTSLALILSLLLSRLFLPSFAAYAEKDLNLDLFNHPTHLVFVVLLFLGVGILAGAYPALFLSRFQPIEVLKGTFKTGSIHKKLRSLLVIAQFAISIMLMVSMMVVWKQLEFIKNKNLGFEKEDILVLPASDELSTNQELIRDRWMQQKGILDVSMASSVPSGRLLDFSVSRAEVDGKLVANNVQIYDLHVSHTFVHTFGMEIVAGRNFDPDRESDSTQAFILNETAISAIGWSSPEEALEKSFHFGDRKGYVIGVVKDFHFESLHQPITPLVLMVAQEWIRELAIKINAEQKEAVLAYLQEEWQGMFPDTPFSYYAVEDKFFQQYEAEEKIGVIFGTFSGLAILLSVLGLLGLTVYSTEQRTREIGIRKVMGASVMNVVFLLGKDFLKLVLAGFLLSVPLAWYGMSQWLENFAYSISMDWRVFVFSGIAAFLIALLTISSQTIRTALQNPVESIQKE